MFIHINSFGERHLNVDVVRIPEVHAPIIEGAEAYELLCPVSKVTGCRENPLQLLKTLINDPAKSRALDMVLAEMPVINSQVNGASYDDMLASLQSVFTSGTFYDDDKFAERLLHISEDLLKTQGISEPIKDVEKPTVDSAAAPAAPAAE